MMRKVCGEFHQEASYCLFFVNVFFSLLFISLFCVNCFCILPLLLDMNEIKSLTVYKVLYRVFFCSGFEYMHVSVHIYKHLALYFFFCLICFCKVLSPPFILTLLDHVVLVSSASTTNTREIKNRFFFSVGAGACHRAPQKLSIQNKRVDFFWIFSRFYDILFTSFCLISLLGFCFLISIRKSTNTYIQYINVSICFHCFVGFMYAIFVFFCLLQYTFIWRCVSRSVGADYDRALQILGYGFHLRHTHKFLKFIAALDY